MENNNTSGYHLTPIPKGMLGEISKIDEELAELKDAITQGDKILSIIELSDLYGAIQFFAQSTFGLEMDDLKNFSDKTIKVKSNG